MPDLWAEKREQTRAAAAPLAVRMRPRTLDEVAGQRHIVGEGRLLRRMLDADALTSVIFHGPPGTGKTTMAEVVANHTEGVFERENAAGVGVRRIREILDEASRRLGEGRGRAVLFLDEIHRFTRAQQDVLLGDVERGTVILVGATTENPLFTVNSALVSRSTLFRFEPLNEEDVAWLLRRAIEDPERGFGRVSLRVSDEAIDHWATISDGDARRALTALEVAVKSTSPRVDDVVEIDLAIAQESIQHKAIVYAPAGDQHYDAASALIKSVRGSDPDAALYWIATMLEAGEDPRFIARRLAILASEDIGNADPQAVCVADACWSLLERIGMPEARITLAQCATYLALAPKSNASYAAIEAALADVREGRTRPIPVFLRDKRKPRSEGSPEEGRGYAYSHAADVNTSIGPVTGQDYLGAPSSYYKPTAIGSEATLRERLAEVVEARRRSQEQREDGEASRDAEGP